MNRLKFIFSFFFFAAISSSLFAQKKVNQTYMDEDKKHLIGLSTRAALMEAPYNEWFEKSYNAYETKTAMLNKSKGKTDNLEIKIFMGTWCGDSKRGVPAFYKVADEIGIDESAITLINLHNASEQYKQSPNGEEKGLNIHRVPTFICYKNGVEIGRIVESPVTDYETDLAQILNDMPSAPNYKGVEQLNEILKTETDFSQENLLTIARKVYRGVKEYRAFNTYGYILQSRKELDKAIAVFEINRMIFPKVARVYDSLAEAYMENGNNDSAIFYFKKVLELEPEHENALAQLATLEKEATSSEKKGKN